MVKRPTDLGRLISSVGLVHRHDLVVGCSHRLPVSGKRSLCVDKGETFPEYR